MRLFVDTSYVGTLFSGSQKQVNAPSVQEKLERAFSTLLQTKVTLVASSRTDAGVHAYQNIFHLEISKKLSTKCTIYAINSLLPHSISVNDIYSVDSTMHARFSARERTYIYIISRKKNPLLHQKAYQYTADLDIKLLHTTADILHKQACFMSFSKKHSQVANHNCIIYNASWNVDEENSLLTFSISANRFLRGMVRAIVATQLDVAMGNLSIKGFKKLFMEPLIASANFAAPAEGLYLKKVSY